MNREYKKNMGDNKMKKHYCIKNSNNEYWNNDFGWITLEGDFEEFPISIFTEEERKQFDLPIGKGVRWIPFSQA